LLQLTFSMNYITGDSTITVLRKSVLYPPNTIMLWLLVSKTAVQSVRGSGTGVPELVRVQTGGCINPLAFAAVQVSAGCPMPPKIDIESLAGS
jgi:hypothetical protein